MADQISSKKILVVDDEPSLCQFISQVLQKEGYQPIVCQNPIQALKEKVRQAE